MNKIPVVCIKCWQLKLQRNRIQVVCDRCAAAIEEFLAEYYQFDPVMEAEVMLGADSDD